MYEPEKNKNWLNWLIFLCIGLYCIIGRSSVDNLADKIDDLEFQIDTLEQEQTELKSKLEKLESKLSDLEFEINYR